MAKIQIYRYGENKGAMYARLPHGAVHVPTSVTSTTIIDVKSHLTFSKSMSENGIRTIDVDQTTVS